MTGQRQRVAAVDPASTSNGAALLALCARWNKALDDDFATDAAAVRDTVELDEDLWATA
jgi:hypothetical protein